MCNRSILMCFDSCSEIHIHPYHSLYLLTM
ncbi:hypothetical protein VPHK571_0310 [Vibrio phage K571]